MSEPGPIQFFINQRNIYATIVEDSSNVDINYIPLRFSEKNFNSFMVAIKDYSFRRPVKCINYPRIDVGVGLYYKNVNPLDYIVMYDEFEDE